MSVIISYQPVKNKQILSHATSSTYEALQRCFGKFPLTLGIDDVGALGGMAAVQLSESGDNSFEALIEAIEKYGEILVSAEW